MSGVHEIDFVVWGVEERKKEKRKEKRLLRLLQAL